MILIIACGNKLRSDDGAGLVLAETLEKAWRSVRVAVEQIAVHQLTPELAVDIAAEAVRVVVFVDTRAVGQDRADANIRIEPITAGIGSSRLGHHLAPAVLLSYVQLLYGKQVSAWEVTVPGVDFSHGEQFSPFTLAALSKGDGVQDLLLALAT